MDSIPFKTNTESTPESIILMLIIIFILIFALFLFNRFIKNKYSQVTMKNENKLHLVDKLSLSLNTSVFIVTNGKKEWLVSESSKTVQIIESEKSTINDYNSKNKEA